jgi:hypothetical protein
MRSLQREHLGWELMASFWKRRASSASVTVSRAEAHVDDAAALDRLLAPLPEASELRPRLNSPFFARAWHAERSCDYWVASDGRRVTCFTISGLTLQQAAAVRVRWDALRSRTELSEELLANLIADQTGTSVTLVS